MTANANPSIARRRAFLRRGVVIGLALVCLAVFTGYFRESSSGPLHDAQSASAAVMGPVQNVATRAVEPFRDAWGWATGLRDARDRAERLQEQVDALQARLADRSYSEARLAELEDLNGVGSGVRGYRRAVGEVIGRSPTPWSLTVRVDVGSEQGVVAQSPVLAGSDRGAQLVGIVTSVRSGNADVALITDGSTEVGATIPDAGAFAGLLQSISPGELRLTDMPREAAVKEGQIVVTGGFADDPNLPNPYPPGLTVGYVSSVGREDVDIDWTVQVTPFADIRQIGTLVVLVPESAAARRRAAG